MVRIVETIVIRAKILVLHESSHVGSRVTKTVVHCLTNTGCAGGLLIDQ